MRARYDENCLPNTKLILDCRMKKNGERKSNGNSGNKNVKNEIERKRSE